MRIITGKYKGKNLKAINTNLIRPTCDSVKEAVFSLLGNYIKESKVLDIFAGSGNLGFESLSRGALSCTFIDNSFRAIEIIKKNAALLKLNINNSDEIRIIKSDALNYLSKFEYFPYDVTFADPPYNKGLVTKVLDIFSKKSYITDGGLLVTETEKDFVVPQYSNLEILEEKIYGITKIIIFKGVSND
jgi:16S rRNA (guanine966-N2)-methyltransferase